MKSYYIIKRLSKSLVLLSLLAVAISGVSFFVSRAKIGADTTSCTVPLFKQTDKAWAGNEYGYSDNKGTSRAYIADAGCGPTAVAMVLKSYGYDVTPAITADFCLRHGYRINGEGTAPGCFAELAYERNLNITNISNRDEVKKWLSTGIPAIVLVGQGPGEDNKYTSGGHYVVITRLVGDTVYINDPNKNISTDSFSNIFEKYYKNGFWFIYRKGSN